MMQSSTSVARSTDDGYWENGNKEHASISALREWNGKALLYVHKRGGGKEEWKRSVSEERKVALPSSKNSTVGSESGFPKASGADRRPRREEHTCFVVRSDLRTATTHRFGIRRSDSRQQRQQRQRQQQQQRQQQLSQTGSRLARHDGWHGSSNLSLGSRRQGVASSVGPVGRVYARERGDRRVKGGKGQGYGLRQQEVEEEEEQEVEEEEEEEYMYDTYKPSNEVQRTERTLFNFLAPPMQESSFMVPKSKSFEREQRTRWCFGCPVTHCTGKDRVHSQGS
uniref:Uncharacterized protein n=1 Tax=Vespula pensylvanica TaxID=30213 RepID=A0A834UBB3_VESPE|nr:hypothetical protein H0235_007183 [Vespula pensylvanica]